MLDYLISQSELIRLVKIFQEPFTKTDMTQPHQRPNLVMIRIEYVLAHVIVACVTWRAHFRYMPTDTYRSALYTGLSF